MEERHVTLLVICGVLALGIIGMAGLTKAQTGALVQNTGQYPSKQCLCQVHSFDREGNIVDMKEQLVRAKSMGGLTDAACDHRCHQMFGKTRRDRVIFGSVANY